MRSVSPALAVMVAVIAVPLWLHGHAPTSLGTSPANPNVTKWAAASTITYRYNNAVGPSLANVQAASNPVGAINAAFSTIGGAAGLTFVNGATSALTDVASDGVNLVTFANTPANVAAVGGAIALTYTYYSIPAVNGVDQILEMDMVFNPAMVFSTLGTANYNDIQGIATHEAGHSIGMGHSPIYDATMFPSSFADFSNQLRTLASDDTAGIRSLYPSAANPQPGTVTAQVQLSGGAAVAGAHVYLRDIITGQATVGAVSRGNGSVNMTGVPPGIYHAIVAPLVNGFTSANLSGSYWSTTTVNANFKTKILGTWADPTEFVVRPSATVSLGTITVTSGSTAADIRLLAAPLPPFSSFNLYQSIFLTPPNTAYIAVAGVGIAGVPDAAFGFDSNFVQITGANVGTGALSGTPPQSYKIFPVSVAANAPAGGYTIRFQDPNTNEMFTVPGAVGVPGTTAPAAYAVPYGVGCPGSLGPLVLTAPTTPTIGNLGFTLALSNTRVNALVYYVIGFSPDALLAAPGCTAWVNLADLFVPFNTFQVTAGSTNAVLPIGIPNDPALSGYKVYVQCLAFDANAPNGYGVSQGLAVRIM